MISDFLAELNEFFELLRPVICIQIICDQQVIDIISIIFPDIRTEAKVAAVAAFAVAASRLQSNTSFIRCRKEAIIQNKISVLGRTMLHYWAYYSS